MREIYLKLTFDYDYCDGVSDELILENSTILDDIKRAGVSVEIMPLSFHVVLADVRADEINKIIHILKYARRYDIVLQHGVDEYYINTILDKLQKISEHFS